MPANRNRIDEWKADVARSVDYYNQWFLDFAPQTFRDTRLETTIRVIEALQRTDNLNNITAKVLMDNPNDLAILRMATAPPIAQDRLVGLADIPKNLLNNMEQENRLPPRMSASEAQSHLERITLIIEQLLDEDIFSWLVNNTPPTDSDVSRAASIVADRLTGAIANPLIRNAQEQRQLNRLGAWLTNQKYSNVTEEKEITYQNLSAGQFMFRSNIPIRRGESRTVNIPIDVMIQPKTASSGTFPLLIEAKSAGDFTNTNKRRKEEATKVNQLRQTYGETVQFILFLCGYFDTGYLGYEAAEGIDWVWEHRIEDLERLGL